jgi:cobalamin biosynthesis protein CobD/CbiB
MPHEESVRTASDVISQVISENKASERLLYGFAIAFVTVGLLILAWAVKNKEQVLAILGFLTSALFWPAMTAVRRTRRENIAIRLLEAPLSGTVYRAAKSA